MSDNEERYKKVLAREKKLKFISSLSVIPLGLSLQASIQPPSPIPLLQDSTVAYTVLGISVIGFAISSILMLPVLKERVALAQQLQKK